MKNTEKYPQGRACPKQPTAASMRVQHESGFLKQNVAIAKWLLEAVGEKRNRVLYVTAWQVVDAVEADNIKQVEKAAACMGLKIVYVHRKQKKWRRGKWVEPIVVYRGIEVRAEPIENWRQEYREYKKRLTTKKTQG